MLLAHQGGWDEMLFVALPIALFAGLLSVANRRATKIQHDREDSAADDTPADGEPADPPDQPNPG